MEILGPVCIVHRLHRIELGLDRSLRAPLSRCVSPKEEALGIVQCSPSQASRGWRRPTMGTCSRQAAGSRQALLGHDEARAVRMHMPTYYGCMAYVNLRCEKSWWRLQLCSEGVIGNRTVSHCEQMLSRGDARGRRLQVITESRDFPNTSRHVTAWGLRRTSQTIGIPML